MRQALRFGSESQSLIKQETHGLVGQTVQSSLAGATVEVCMGGALGRAGVGGEGQGRHPRKEAGY